MTDDDYAEVARRDFARRIYEECDREDAMTDSEADFSIDKDQQCRKRVITDLKGGWLYCQKARNHGGKCDPNGKDQQCRKRVISDLEGGWLYCKKAKDHGGKCEVREQLKQLAKEMGDAGYCNYAACEEFLQKAFEAGRLQGREEVARYAECYGIIGRKLAADIREKK